MTAGEGICLCIHAVVESTPSARAQVGRVALYNGTFADRSESSQGGEAALLWSSAADEVDVPDDVETESEVNDETNIDSGHLELMLRRDGNLVLMATHPRHPRMRQEMVWESATAGEESMYTLELTVAGGGSLDLYENTFDSMEEDIEASRRLLFTTSVVRQADIVIRINPERQEGAFGRLRKRLTGLRRANQGRGMLDQGGVEQPEDNSVSSSPTRTQEASAVTSPTTEQ